MTNFVEPIDLAELTAAVQRVVPVQPTELSALQQELLVAAQGIAQRRVTAFLGMLAQAIDASVATTIQNVVVQVDGVTQGLAPQWPSPATVRQSVLAAVVPPALRALATGPLTGD